MFSMRSIKSSPLRCALMALMAMASFVAQAGTVSGQVVMGGVSFKPAQIAAFRDRASSDPRTFMTLVVLTIQPIKAEKISQSLDPWRALREDPAAAADRIDVFVLADGTIEVGAQLNDDSLSEDAYPSNSKGVPGALVGTCKTNTTTHVACTVKTRKATPSRNGKPTVLALTFDADVLARTKGQPLADDGGEPGKALRELYAAAAGDNVDAVLARLLPKQLAEQYRTRYALTLEIRQEHGPLPDRTLQSLKEIFDLNLPKAPKVTGGESRSDDDALVEIEGMRTSFGRPERILELVEMRRVDGTWRFVDANEVGTFR